MSEPENFLERWSRRKREAGADTAPERVAQNEAAALPESGETGKRPQAEESRQESALEVPELPSIDSIGADTDVRGFLRPGVPTDLTRAALRRAWTSDPAIRDFVGLVENGWDFNDPDAIPGFGRIAAGDAGRLLSQAIGQLLPETESVPEVTRPAQPQENPAAAPESARVELAASDLNPDRTASQDDAGIVQCENENDALQNRT